MRRVLFNIVMAVVVIVFTIWALGRFQANMEDQGASQPPSRGSTAAPASR